ncbi:MAG: GNAT family N-acetyltransferase [Erythrobacter sp.]|nr:GNAT family N-acetyltransferase [Erythrobacter sp.]
MEVRLCDLTEPDVVALLDYHDRAMRENSPPGTNHSLNLSGLRQPDIEVLALYGEDERLLAVGALRRHADFAELKSMRTHPEALGQGAGRAILAALIERARAHGFATVKLETGSGPYFAPALGLYESFGFRPCSAFAQYQPGEFNQLFALDIAADGNAAA